MKRTKRMMCRKFLTSAIAMVLLTMNARAVEPISSWDTNLSSVIHSDVTQSVVLPSGDTLWVFGDTTSVNGISTVSGYGYPHNAFVVQSGTSQTFTAKAGPYGYGWMQVPNWSDGSYFWMATPIVDGNFLYVLGQRVTGGANFTIVGSYVAVFNVTTLAYQRIVPIPDGPSGTVWGGVAKTSKGWWITGTHAVPCSGAVNCKAGDMAFVPFGSLAVIDDWTTYYGVVSSTTDIGTTLAMYCAHGKWNIYTKRGDAYGTNQIEHLTADNPLAVWSVDATLAAPYPAGTVTYGVAVHPEQSAPAGQILVSYNVNGVDSEYYARFLYLPL
jgi:hypothetical protein